MHGLPNVLQTRADFDAALALAADGEVDKASLAQHFAGLIEATKRYSFDRILADGEEADGDMPEFCVTEASERDPVRRQLKIETDTVARLFVLGYTIDEVETIIKDLEGK